MGSLMVAPIISGSMALHVGWRNFWWLNTALLILSFVMVVFMFPETKWHRLHPDEIMKNIVAEGKTSSPTGSQEKVPAAAIPSENAEKTDIEAKSTPQNMLNELTHEATAERDPWLGKGSPSKQQWRLFQPNAHPFKTIFLDLWIPWKLFAFPIVEFSAFVVSWSCSSFLTINRTSADG